MLKYRFTFIRIILQFSKSTLLELFYYQKSLISYSYFLLRWVFLPNSRGNMIFFVYIMNVKTCNNSISNSFFATFVCLNEFIISGASHYVTFFCKFAVVSNEPEGKTFQGKVSS